MSTVSYVRLLFITVFMHTVSCAKQVIFANLVWRHGDRSYMLSYPNDPYKDKHIWKNGLGQLTNIGMKEQYELGKYLRIRYDGLLSKDYLRKEIFVRSTDVDRTLMSAQCNMAGLFPPTESELWNGSSTSWHPIPVHTVPLETDKLLRYPYKNCPKYTDIMKTIEHSPWFIEHEKNYSSFYEFIRNVTGSEVPYNLTTIWAVEDNLFCLKSNNFTLPEWATPEVVSTLKHLNSLSMGLLFTDIDYKYRSYISKMQGGVLLKEIIKNMTSHIAGKSNYSVIAYSAHDTTLTALLVSIGAYDWVQPTYASCIMVELLEDAGKYFVRMYLKSLDGTVRNLKFYDCDEDCAFDDFVEIAQNLMTDDRDALCGNKKAPEEFTKYKLIALICVCSVFALALISLLFYTLCSKKKQVGHVYSKVETNEDDPPI